MDKEGGVGRLSQKKQKKRGKGNHRISQHEFNVVKVRQEKRGGEALGEVLSATT